jgi:hypothetical protein
MTAAIKSTSGFFIVLATAPILYMTFFSLAAFQDYNATVILGMLLLLLPYFEHRRQNLGIIIPVLQLLIVLGGVIAGANFLLMLELAAGYLLVYPLFSIWLLATETKVGSLITIYVSSYIASVFTYSTTISGKTDSVGLVGSLAAPFIQLVQKSSQGQSYPPILYGTDIVVTSLSAIGTIGFLLYVLWTSAAAAVGRQKYSFDVFSRVFLFVAPLAVMSLIGFTLLGDYLLILFAAFALGLAIFLRTAATHGNLSRREVVCSFFREKKKIQ